MLLAELGMRVFFYIAKALIFRREQKHPKKEMLAIILRAINEADLPVCRADRYG